MKKMTSYILGAALASASLFVSAQEPMTLTDQQMDGISAGGLWTTNGVFFAGGELIKSIKRGRYDVRAHVRGNIATADASADASGLNTDSETWTATSVVQGLGSASVSKSVSLTNGAHYYFCHICFK